jgi:hypothetical protein
MGQDSKLSLYQKILGDDFGKLPLVFQKMHGTPKATFAKGTVTVSNGKHWLAKIARPFLPIPAKGTYPLILKVSPSPKGEVWERKFPKHNMCSLQYLYKGVFYEKFGIFTLVLISFLLKKACFFLVSNNI